MGYQYKPIGSSFSKIYQSMDKSITSNLKEGVIETRPANANGIWCHMLLPCVLCMYYLLDDVTNLQKSATFLSIGLFTYCSLFVMFLSLSNIVIRGQSSVYAGCVVSSLISTLMFYVVLDYCLSISLCISALTIFSFNWLLRHSLVNFPKTFTIGEVMIVLQGVTLFTITSVLNYVFKYSDATDEMAYIYFIVQTVLVTVALMVTVLLNIKKEYRNLKTLNLIIMAGGIFALTLLHYELGSGFMAQFVKYVFDNFNRGKLVTFWLILVVLSIISLMLRTKLALKATTVTRKVFHVLACLVFMSGILFDIPLTLLAAGIGLGLLIFIEALRKSEIEPISSALQAAFLIYSDDKDCGSFAMTPIYLYVGLSSPLLLAPGYAPAHSLELLCGVLSIGVGDTAASWFGSKYGFNKWSNSNKTMEGTAFNILSQVAVVYALVLFGLLDTRHPMTRTAFAATLTSLVEAKTDQVDNLVLPFTMMIALQFTRIFF